MGVDFLEFLRSGETDIHAFLKRQQGLKRRQKLTGPTTL
jgi:hypothetical protein